MLLLHWGFPVSPALIFFPPTPFKPLTRRLFVYGAKQALWGIPQLLTVWLPGNNKLHNKRPRKGIRHSVYTVSCSECTFPNHAPPLFTRTDRGSGSKDPRTLLGWDFQEGQPTQPCYSLFCTTPHVLSLHFITSPFLHTSPWTCCSWPTSEGTERGITSLGGMGFAVAEHQG